MAWHEAFAQDASIVVTLLLLEAVLSFDNAAILAAMVRKLPAKDRRKALLYGLVGAYGLRFAAILLASFLIANPVLKLIGGGYLVFIGVKHFYGMLRYKRHEHKEQALRTGLLTRMGVPVLVAVIIQIEVIDLAFAIDQVLVAVAFTDKVYLIVIASFVGILFLRLAAAMIARIMDWLPLLEHMAYVAVVYVGVKLILLYELPFINDGHGVHIPTQVSIGITLTLFLLPVLIKVFFGLPRSLPEGHHAAAVNKKPASGGPGTPQAAGGDAQDAPQQAGGAGHPPRPPSGA